MLKRIVKRALYIAAILLAIEGLFLIWYYAPRRQTQEAEKIQYITVLVHGTIRASATTKDLLNLYRDRPEFTLYAQRLSHVRQDPFFYQAQAMQEEGLQPIDMQSIEKNPGIALFSHLYDINERYINGTVVTNNYYSFGWSGVLSHRERMRASEVLYNSLNAEVEKYKALGIKTKIRLIGYSHGGTVSFNVAHVAPRSGNQLSIDQLVLIGTPITRTALEAISNPMFKKVYSIFSIGDSVQTMDFVTTAGHQFPNRVFKPSRNLAVPKKLKQIRIVLHTQQKKKGRVKKRTVDPNHIELWFFDWGRDFQRNLPTGRAPVAVFIPNIIAAANTVPEQDVTVNVSATNGELCFKAGESDTCYSVIPHNKIQSFMQILEDCVPANYIPECKKRHKEINRITKSVKDDAPAPRRPRARS